MALITYPLNNVTYSAEDAELYNSTRSSGIYAEDSFKYSMTGSDNIITIGNGIGWIKNGEFSGKVIANKNPENIDMGISDSLNPRIDAIVIRFDSITNETNIVVKHGTPASSPVAPEVVRSESIYELHLYHVARAAGALYVSSRDVTDLRLNKTYCGLMADSVTHIDTSAIESQVLDLIQNLKEEIENAKSEYPYLLRTGGTMTGNIEMGGNSLSGLAEPINGSDAATKKTIDKAIAGVLTMDLLWENASPTSDFAAQTIAVDLTGYDLILIVFLGMQNTYSSTHGIIPKEHSGETKQFAAVRYQSGLYAYLRNVTADFALGTIAFGGGLQNATANDGRIIPQFIYGIKGVNA